jgi:hypothetical protein
VLTPQLISLVGAMSETVAYLLSIDTQGRQPTPEVAVEVAGQPFFDTLVDDHLEHVRIDPPAGTGLRM